MSPVFECDIDEAECCGPIQAAEPSASETTCKQGNVAQYAVNVGSAEDVKTAVSWAAAHNVALSVKATGHDFQGRSTSKDTLNIWMHNLKGVSYFEDWSPTECASDAPQKAMEVLGGD